MKYYYSLIVSRLFALSFFLLFSLCSYSQLISSSDIDVKSRVARFDRTTTLVVIEEDDFSYFNIVIGSAFQNHWKINNYKFITAKEVKNYTDNNKYSFLSLGYFKDDSRSIENPNYYGLSLSLYSPLSLNVVSYSFGRDSIPVLDQVYKIIAIVQMMQEFLVFHKNKLQDQPIALPEHILDYYNTRRKELNGKRILVAAEDLKKSYSEKEKMFLLSIEGIEKTFSVKPEIVTASEIGKAVLDQNENIAFVDGYGKYTNIVTAKGGRVIASGKGYIPNYKRNIIKTSMLVLFVSAITWFLANS